MPKLLLPSPLPPIRASCTTFFGRQKQRLARITEPSNDNLDNDVSDNCDHNFGTFGDFGVKNDQKVSHNMILMSKYKAMPEEFFFRMASHCSHMEWGPKFFKMGTSF